MVQTLPQKPQLLGSVDVWTQEPLQRTEPIGHITEASRPASSSWKSTPTAACPFRCIVRVTCATEPAVRTASTGAATHVGVVIDVIEPQSTAKEFPENVSVPSGRPLNVNTVDCPGITAACWVTVRDPATVISTQAASAGAASIAIDARPTSSPAESFLDPHAATATADTTTATIRFMLFIRPSMCAGLDGPGRASLRRAVESARLARRTIFEEAPRHPNGRQKRASSADAGRHRPRVVLVTAADATAEALSVRVQRALTCENTAFRRRHCAVCVTSRGRAISRPGRIPI
jgi:hypothetical protein